MSDSVLPVVAVVPNYNMAGELQRLLPQLLEQDYTQIFVLDDASTDNSRTIVEQFAPQVTLVAGKRNRGAGANRNRIIKALSYHALIHFIDADTILTTEHTIAAIRHIVPSDAFGFIGGLVTNTRGVQHPWNYGPRQCLYTDIAANLQTIIGLLAEHQPGLAKVISGAFRKMMAGWPDVFATPERRQVFWAVEANLVVDSRTFRELGGFDESLREHETQDLAIRMAELGLKCYFDPRLSVQHTNAKVRPYNRTLAYMRNELLIARKYGFRQWLLPGGRFRPKSTAYSPRKTKPTLLAILGGWQ